MKNYLDPTNREDFIEQSHKLLDNFWEDSLPYYPHTKANGYFVMRDFYTNELINRKVLGLSGYAQEILNSYDFYGCMTKRYLKYFTGIDVPILYRPNNELSNIEKFHRELTRKLKENKITMMDLINNIIQSQYFFKDENE